MGVEDEEGQEEGRGGRSPTNLFCPMSAYFFPRPFWSSRLACRLWEIALAAAETREREISEISSVSH